jgi:hypothetical protein
VELSPQATAKSQYSPKPLEELTERMPNVETEALPLGREKIFGATAVPQRSQITPQLFREFDDGQSLALSLVTYRVFSGSQPLGPS